MFRAMRGSSNLSRSNRLFTRAALAVCAALFAVAAPAQASSDPPFPITESFSNATAPGWNTGGIATLTGGGVDTAGNGWLRLTDATTSQSGYAYYDTAFPSSKGAAVEFDYATYGGTGADGLTFFLYDGTTTAAQFQIGAFGGSLGYAPCSNGSKPGLKNAYTGVGFDEFGNFTNLTTSCGVPGGNTAHPNYVSVRGSQAANYDLLSTAATTQALTATRANARHVTISVLPNGKLNTYIKYPDGTFQHIVSDLQLPAAPSTLKLGFAASTGGSTNIHEIRNTTVVKPTDISTTVTDGGAGKPRASANTWTAVVTNSGPNDTNSGSFKATTTQSLTNVSWTCTPSAGSSCGAATSGTGLPDIATGAMALNGTLTFQITGTPAAATDYAQLTVNAQPTGDTGDLTPTNNASSDTSDLTPVFDAQPTFTLTSGGLATATTTNARGGNITYANRWQRCDPDGSNCVDIAGATATTYTTTTADRGFTIRFTRTATNAAGSTVSASAHYSPLPTTNLLSAPSGATTSTSAAPTFSTPTSGATLECKLDASAWATCTSPKSYTGLAEGSHTFSVRAVYGGLSDDTPASATWVVDTTAPNTSITSQPAANESSTSADLGFTGTDPSGSGVASYECRLDAGAWGACTSPKSYTGLSQGNHTFDVRAIDAAGNVDATPASYTWRVDTVNPDTTIDTKPVANSGSATGNFTFSGTDPSGSGVASYECRLDSGAWAACTSPKAFTSLADGNHTVDVRTVDTAGNKDTTPASYTWRVDTTAPDTTIDTKPASNSGSATGNFTFSGTDPSGSGVASYECRLDNGAWAACTSPKAFTGLTQGNHTVDVRAIDTAGNVDATPASYTWRVDTTAPDTAINTKPAANSGSTTGNFTFSGTDPSGSGVASYECRLDNGAWVACTTPKSYTGLADGSHTVDVRAIDSAGNTDASPASYTWTVDTANPTTSLGLTPSAESPSADASFTFTGSDPGGSGVTSFQCRLDGGTWTTCTSPKDLTGLADGDHTFEVRSVDAAGNADGTPQSYTWTVDTTAPDTAILTHPADPTGSADASLTFSGTDGAGTGVASYECQLDGGTWNACVSPKDFTGLADGSHTFKVRAIDGAGNTDATPASFTWVVDTTAPDTQLTSTPSPVSGSTTGAFAFTGTDPSGSGVASFECRLDGGSWSACTSPQSWTGLAEGSHTVDVRAIDAAGNKDATPASYTWTVDTTGPNTTITTHPAANTSATNATFGFTGDDGSGGGVASYECQLDGGAWTTCSAPKSYTGLADGSHTFKVRAVDAGGNPDTSPDSYTWTVDTGAPTTTLTGNPPAVSATPNPSFTFTGADAGGSGVASFECRLDGGSWVACTSPKDFTGLTDGSHTFDVRAIDAAGNADATPSTYTWTIDTAGPPATPETPAKPTADRRPELTFTTEPGATIEIKIDGVVVGTTTAGPDGTATFTPPTDLSDGTHEIVVVGIDDLGNRGPASAPVPLKVAATPPPKPTIPSSPAPVSSDQSPIFSLDGGGGSGDTTFECQLDDGSWVPCPATVTFPNLPDGTHTLKVREVNEAGVPGGEREYTWTVDTTKPELPVYVVTPPAKTPDVAARFDLKTEPGTTLRCSVDGGPLVDCTSGLDLSALTEGTHKIVAIAIDEAGNESAPASYDWLVATPLASTASLATLTARLATKTIIHANKRMTIICRLSKGSTVQTCDGKAYARLKGKLVLVATGKRTLNKTGSLSAGVRVKLNKVGMAALKRHPEGLKVSVKMVSKTREGKTLTTRVNTKIYAARKTAHPILSPVDSASAFGPGGKLRSQIKSIAKNIKGAKSVLCVGHTDNTGSVADGLARAKAACAELKALGVDAKFTTQSKGSTAPRATNKTPKGRALNRRVVLLVRFP